MISQLHVLSPRGDCIITRDFRQDCPAGTAESFFRKAKASDGNPPPVFTLEGTHYVSVNKSGVYFVLTTQNDISPIWGVDLISKLVKSMKDFCGVLSEESLRRNFILLYELIDEVFDSGYPQTTAAEQLKLAVHSDAVELTTSGLPNLIANPMSILPQLRSMTSPSSTIPSTANQRPIGISSGPASSPGSSSFVLGGVTIPSGIKIPGLTADRSANSTNEIFVDILERINVVVNGTTGQVVKSSIDGAIQMKSYLSGNPALKISLSEDLVIMNEDRSSYSNFHQTSTSTVVDSALFHESADLTDFPVNRIINIIPPDGEFVLMNYRISNAAKLPFRVYPSVEIVSADKVEIQVSVKADLPEQNYGSNVVVSMPVPEGIVRSAFTDVTGSTGHTSAEHDAVNNRLVWTIKKLPGGQEIVCRAKLTVAPNEIVSPKSFGPISLHFEVPMFSLSNLQVRYLRIQDAGRFGSSPTGNGGHQRWVRYVAQSQSYLYRF